MNKITLIAALVALTCASLTAQAENINYRALEQEGFGNIAQLLKSMTPEQQAAILKQAANEMKNLEAMAPQEREQLLQQMHHVASTLDIENIDPEKLDPSKAKEMHQVQKDLSTYQQKYHQGSISHEVVKPAPMPRD